MHGGVVLTLSPGAYAACPPIPFTFLLQQRPLFLSQVSLPPKCLPLPLQLTVKDRYTQLHALALLLLLTQSGRKETEKDSERKYLACGHSNLL